MRPFSCRLPRIPGWGPPIPVSSTSTSPCNGSRAAFTIARRSLRWFFVAPQGQLPLHPQGRRAALVGNHQVGRPEPGRQRRLRIVQDRARRERHLMPTAGALPSPMRHRICAPMLAPRTDASVRPATGGQVPLAGRLGRELALTFAQILRKCRARHARTLQVVVC